MCIWSSPYHTKIKTLIQHVEVTVKIPYTKTDEKAPKNLEVQVNLEYLSDGSRMYFFPCDDVKIAVSGNKPEEERCGDEALNKFILANINMPVNLCSLEGTVIVQFSVINDGYVFDMSILEENGGGCGEEVLRVVKKMPKWMPVAARLSYRNEVYKLQVKFK